MAEATAQNQATQTQTQQGAAPKMPEIDFAGLNKFLQEQGQNAGAQPQQSAQQAQQPQAENPDTGAVQDGFANIKDGDTFTDENGQQWQYTVMNFNVVPEDVKDEMVDDISATEEEVQGENESQSDSDIEGSDAADYDENLSRGLDIALSILNEEDDENPEGEGATSEESDTGVAQDSAYDLLMRACDEVIGDSAVAQDGVYTTGKPLTMRRRREGWNTNNPAEIAPYHWRRKNVTQNPDGSYHVGHYGTEANLKARENARQSHRQAVAATWDKCKAKDPYKCRWHGAAFMRDSFANIMKASGLPIGKIGIEIRDPETRRKTGKNEPIPYRLIFTTPVDTPNDVKTKCVRDFFLKHPDIVFDLPKGSEIGDVEFEVRKPEDIDDMPIDAPRQEDYQDRQDTQSESSWNERANARAAVSYASRDTLDASTYFDMLSEHPRNIVELNEDMMRYLVNFPDCVPEGMTEEDVKGLYNQFREADIAKKSLSAFLVNGETDDDATKLAEDATQGLEKERAAYDYAAQSVYDVAADIFNNVQNKLYGQYEDLQKTVNAMPPARVVGGNSSGYERTYYFGKKYKSSGKKFPMKISGEAGEVLKETIEEYVKCWSRAKRVSDKIMEGCETRDPLRVERGIQLSKIHLQALQRTAQSLGMLQDKIIEAQSDKWRKKNGISVQEEKKQKKAEGTSSGQKPGQKNSEEKQKVIKTAVEEEQQTTKQEPVQPATPKSQEEPKDEPHNNQQPTEQKPIEKKKEEKPKKKVPQSMVVKMAKGESSNKADSQSNESKEDGAGVNLIKSMQIPDKPSVDSAKALNKQFAELEKRLRGLAYVFKSKTSDSKDWKDAESEMKSIKSEIDNIIKKAQGKGYQWTKDNTREADRPLDVPVNFHISGITDETGNTVEIPYKPPRAGEMDKIVSTEAANTSPSAKESTPSGGAKINYDKVFEDAEKEVGSTKNGTLTDLIDLGYVVKPYKSKDGTIHNLLAKIGDGPQGIDTSYPYYGLDRLAKAHDGLIEAINRRVKKFRASVE